ncbi:chemotaxis protein CheA [Shewanella zhangzhouensis]|uniref:chemotaxis protein CheA n=1 Tax=Shewanella zhangzhouensis TaxID=2864213 RepID=UPI001C658AC9|nr:chemotaxis protein CheA [Shewanella zhangzhouensis]QYK03558.1 chemotaxis protein CheA [Shewanella zhangzhouensis]
MELDAVLRTYFDECEELLEDMEQHLLLLESVKDEDISESFNAIFRAAHTIKGSAGIFNFEEIVSFTHVVESVLDKLRSNQIGINEQLVSLLFQSRDHIKTLVNNAELDFEPTPETRMLGEKLVEELNSIIGRNNLCKYDAEEECSNHESKVLAFSSDSNVLERTESNEVENDFWHISLMFGESAFRDGMDPLSFLAYLDTLGKIISIDAIHERIPGVQEFDPETCYLGFEIQFKSDASKQEIEDVFDFIREESEIHIIPPHSELAEYISLINDLPDIDIRLGEILVCCGALTTSELDKALAIQKAEVFQNDTKPIGEIISEKNSSLQPVLNAAVEKQVKIRDTIAKEQKSIRVDSDKLDDLINLVGELVTSGAGTSMQANLLGDSNMIESVSILTNLLDEVRDAALKLRMVPIGATFTRFQRVVRDISKELGKDISLVINGADTELDKSVVEKIGDPLMHLVRNAIDHGIEYPAVRLDSGKSKIGTITLNAFHDSGNIIIDISDDGKGLDANIIRAKAIDKGFLSDNDNLNEEELLNLIFEPGFSTAVKVTNLSGRGVGLDVVKRNISELRGRVDVKSELGKGTTIRIILPLTLAIIDGFIVSVKEQVFVLPLDRVHECVELEESKNLSSDVQPPLYLNLRGQVLPLIYLREHFEIVGLPPKRQNVVVVQAHGLMAGLVVDRLLGEFQAVIKPLGPLFSKVSSISGSTILGSGEVALILDIQGMIDAVAHRRDDDGLALSKK